MMTSLFQFKQRNT